MTRSIDLSLVPSFVVANTTGVVINAFSYSVGTSLVANTLGVYHTGLVNAASFRTSGLVANTTAITPTSNTILLGNSTGRFVLSANTGNFSGAVSGITTLGAGNTSITGFANASVSVNSALLTVGSSFIANTTGAYHTGVVSATGGVKIGAGTTTSSPISLTSGTNLTTQTAGAIEYDGSLIYQTIDTTNGRGISPTDHYFILKSNLAATATTISPFFGTSSAIPLVASGLYEIDFVCVFLKNTAGTLVWTFTNSTTVTDLVVWSNMTAITGSGTTGTWAAPLQGVLRGATAAAVALPATGSLTTAVYHSAIFKVILQNGSSTSLRLNVTNSAGTVTPNRGSFWKARRINNAGNVSD